MHQLETVLREGVGEFGALTIPPPSAAYSLWWLLVLGVVGLAAAVGGRRSAG